MNRSVPTNRLCVVLGGCLAVTGAGCLDVLGYEEDVSQQSGIDDVDHPTDDRIEDKHPVFDPARIVTDQFSRFAWDICAVQMNKSAAVTRLDILPFAGASAQIEGQLFRGRPEALSAVTSADATADAIPSMEVVNGYLKPFDDGLYAAVELAAEADKRSLVTDLLARVTASATTADAAGAAFGDAAVMLGAALILDGQTPALIDPLLGRAQARATRFLAEPIYSRPIGFYDWTPDLQAIFTRDRFLQNGDQSESFGGLAALALVLGSDPALLARYQRVTGLYTGLTDPFQGFAIDALIPYVPSASSLLDIDAVQAAFVNANPPALCQVTAVAFLPASRSRETDFFQTGACQGTIPAGTSLFDALVAAIRDGTVDLTPAADSGWYDYQEYALQTLLVPDQAPEDQNLLLSAGYKKKLVDTFKSILIETRETHVKQLSGGADAAATISPVDAYPLFASEPFPTFYLRLGRGYRFLRTFLQADRGATFLTGTARVLENGARSSAMLADELGQRINVLYGLSFLAADAVGMNRTQGVMADELAEIDPDAAVTAARTWLKGWQSDPDVTSDPRVVVPLYFADAVSPVTYAAVVGVKAVRSHVEYVAGHEPVGTPTLCWSNAFVAHDYVLLTEDSVQFTLPASRQPPTRAEFRAICDAHRTSDDIVKALEAP